MAEYKAFFGLEWWTRRTATERITFWLTNRTWQFERITLLMILWPWITLASYGMFWITIRRARIQWRHLVRVAVYTSDIAAPALLVMFVLMFFDVQTLGRNGAISRWLVANIGVGWESTSLFFNAVCLQFILMIRLLIASKRYLAVSNGIVLALLTQVVFLLMLTIAAGRM